MIREALKALWEYRVRAVLTLSILAFGITALVGILTALEALRVFIATRLAGLGTQAFLISSSSESLAGKRGRGILIQLGGPKAFRWWEVRQFLASYRFPGAQVSPAVSAALFERAYYQGRKTPSRVRLLGVAPTYFHIQQLSLASGRLFTPAEVAQHQPVIVLGSAIADLLFPQESPLGKEVRIGGRYFTVVGVLRSRGSLFGFNLDEECFIPWTTAWFMSKTPGADFYVGVERLSDMEAAMAEARRVLRAMRRLTPRMADNFSFLRGEQVADLLLDLLKTLTTATIGISLITLLGATLSFTNILLVIVKERTQEIGLRMALGASRQRIAWQFLSEAIVIALVGGGAGILFGLLMGNGVALLLGAKFVMPWKWVGIAVGLTSLVGLIAGYRPAQEAARLNPVDALRYE
jgi:putative ABC transport system permease protein